MIEHRTFDGRIQLVEYKPRVLEHPPLGALRDVAPSTEGRRKARTEEDTRRRPRRARAAP